MSQSVSVTVSAITSTELCKLVGIKWFESSNCTPAGLVFLGGPLVDVQRLSWVHQRDWFNRCSVKNSRPGDNYMTSCLVELRFCVGTGLVLG